MDYNSLLKKLQTYEKDYNVKIIGKTYLKNNIYAVEKFLSEDFFTAVFVGATHAREHITTDLLCKFLDDKIFDEIKGFNISVVPLLNPDGADLCINGLLNVCDENKKQKLSKINNNSADFSLFKANARGVDINNNFDANFGQNVHSKTPASQGFIGKVAESENETKAICEYLRKIKPFLVVTYHTKGEEIYFNFFQKQKELERDKKIAKIFSKSTGYKIRNVENVSSGGLKDWCVQKLKIPSLTIECASDDLIHPIENKYLQDIYNTQKNVAKDAEEAYNIFIKYL